MSSLLPGGLLVRAAHSTVLEIPFTLKVAQYSFSGPIPPKFEHKLRRHKKVLEKLPPQLYYIKMKICYDQGCNGIGVVIATK